MSRFSTLRWPWFVVGGAVFIGLAWGGYQLGLPAWHRYQAQQSYAREDWSRSRQHLQAWLATQPSLLEQGKAQVLLAEISLQEDQQTAAETAILQGVLQLRQWQHEHPQSDTAWLKQALESHVLIELRPLMGLTEDDMWYLDLRLHKVAPVIADIKALGPSRLKALTHLMEQPKQLLLWREFVQAEPLYRRLQVKPVVLPAPQAPKDQQAVREVVHRWQNLKRGAFVHGESEALAQVLTGDALSESLQAVQWWIDHDAHYWRLELQGLRFLRIEYPEATQAQVVAEVHELRDNSREGVVEQTYQVEYTLVKLGDDWFISTMKVRT